MSSRYFFDGSIQGNRAKIHGPEAHHLLHVKRARRGEKVVLFDGSGTEYEARLEDFGRDWAELTILQSLAINRELPVRLVIASALPKGDRQRWLIEKLVELGVTEFAPLITQRSVVALHPAGLARLRRVVVEASKQCGRNVLMQIAEPVEWPNFLQREDLPLNRLIAHTESDSEPPEDPSRAPLQQAVSIRLAHGGCGVVVAVGPEGGFSPEEVQAAIVRGWKPVWLGPRTLRIETAAEALAAIFAAQLSGLL